jgi:hypothetical protein
VFGHAIRSRLPAGVDECEVVAWFARHALLAAADRRRLNRWERERRLLHRTAHRTYYDHRTAYVQALGYRSLWHYRQARRWT